MVTSLQDSVVMRRSHTLKNSLTKIPPVYIHDDYVHDLMSEQLLCPTADLCQFSRDVLRAGTEAARRAANRNGENIPPRIPRVQTPPWYQ